MNETETRPCEYCGKSVTKTAEQKRLRKHWTCGQSCSASLAHQEGRSPDKWSKNPYRGQKETRPCAICGKPVTHYLTPERIKQAWTCSIKCSVKQRTIEGKTKPRRGDIINCAVCGKEFYRQPVYIKQDRRLCSLECNKKWQARNQITKNCLYCGKEFIVRPSEAGIKYCSRECEANSKIKRPTGRMHNGRPVIENYAGYLTVYEPTSPMASRTGRVLEHRFVMAEKIGRPLMTDEQVNHINHDKQDNRPENLEIMNPTDHSRETGRYTNNKRLSEAEELAEYRKRFGPL